MSRSARPKKKETSVTLIGKNYAQHRKITPCPPSLPNKVRSHPSSQTEIYINKYYAI